ncbi:putative toxin-antitoxin system toxin component, PIN family [Salegentibacter echinorum]|nr:putative toxin-antitoxin system toxin component, PIN family [Salegentibacter echinorum]
MKKTNHRIILDTNLWISFLLTRDFSKMDILLKNKEIKLLFSQELLDEFIEVAKRPKFEKYFSIPDLQLLMKEIKSKAVFINVKKSVQICRDPKDNFLLSLAIAGKATHLLTGDKDLLILEELEYTKIQTIKTYFEEF